MNIIYDNVKVIKMMYEMTDEVVDIRETYEHSAVWYEYCDDEYGEALKDIFGERPRYVKYVVKDYRKVYMVVDDIAFRMIPTKLGRNILGQLIRLGVPYNVVIEAIMLARVVQKGSSPEQQYKVIYKLNGNMAYLIDFNMIEDNYNMSVLTEQRIGYIMDEHTILVLPDALAPRAMMLVKDMILQKLAVRGIMDSLEDKDVLTVRICMDE